MEATKKTTTKATATSPAKKTTTKVATAKKTTTKVATAKKTTTKVASKTEVKEVKAEKVATTKAVKAAKAAKATKASPMVKVTLVKSPIGRGEKQQRTVQALGLRKIRSSAVLPDNACTRGMIFVVKHLVTVEEVK